MPTYQYACTNPECGERFELVQSFTDPAASECPVCAGPVRKVFSAVGVVFKGSGFYRNDSRSGTSGSPGSSSKDGSGKDGSSSKEGASKDASAKDGGSKESSSTSKSESSAKSDSSSSSASSSSSGSGSSSKAAAPA